MLLGGIARGDREAAELFLDAHARSLYGLLRMLIASPSEADAALCRVFAAAAEAAGEFPPDGGRGAEEWLAAMAFEEAAFSWSPIAWHEAVDGDAPPGDRVGNDRELLAGLDPSLLAVLARGLEFRCRQALVLGVVRGLGDESVATVIGVSSTRVPALKRAALADLRRMLEAGRTVHEPGPPVATETASHLRPLGGGRGGGRIVVRGTAAQVEPPRSPLELARRALDRIFGADPDRTVERPHDDVGGPGAPVHPGGTPSTLARQRPDLYGGERLQPLPPTAGTAGHSSPQRTPSTETLRIHQRPAGR